MVIVNFYRASKKTVGRFKPRKRYGNTSNSKVDARISFFLDRLLKKSLLKGVTGYVRLLK